MARYRLPAVPALPRGVTVIEMMVVVMVLAIILALAVPSMRDFMARQRVKAINAELVTDLQYARSEAVSRGREVYVTFRSDDRANQPPMTCYTIHTMGTATGRCDCRKPVGTSCLTNSGASVENLVEIKTVQILRANSVTVHAPPAPANQLIFTKTQGLSVWDGHDALSPTYVSGWVDYPIAVESSISGKLRTSTNITGRPQVCSPDASIPGVPPCTD